MRKQLATYVASLRLNLKIAMANIVKSAVSAAPLTSNAATYIDTHGSAHARG